MVLGSVCKVANSSFRLIRPLQANASPEGTLPGGIDIVESTPRFSLSCFDVCHLFLPSTHRLWGGKMTFVRSITLRGQVLLGRGENGVHETCRTQALRHRITSRGINHLTGNKRKRLESISR